jgi:serine/threonine-protein kinase
MPSASAGLGSHPELFGERFKLEGFLGEGGFAAVYLVRNRRLDRLEALKVLRFGNLDPDFSRRFVREAKIAAGLDHPNIVKVYDFGQSAGMHWYSMQYIDGQTLADLLRQLKPLEPDEALRIALPLLEALAYSHAQGVIHRDIKPGNVLLDRRGRPYLADFGLAKSTMSTTMSMAGNVIGTPAYISPEQARGQPLDARSDLYSFGITLYELLTGELPFQGSAALDTVVVRLTTDPIPISAKRLGIDPRLEAAVLRALSREPARRQQNAEELRSELADCVRAEPEAVTTGPISARLASLLEASSSKTMRVDTTERSRRRLRLGLAAAIVVAVIAAGTSAWVWSRGRIGAGRPSDAPGSVRAAAAGPTMPARAPAEVPAASAASAGLDPAADQPPPAPLSAPPVATRAAPAPEPIPRRAVRPPRLLQQVEPLLDEELSVLCAGGIVNLSIRIGVDGLVQSSRLLSTPEPRCAPAVVEAARRFVYSPALDQAGEPIETTIAIAVHLGAGASPVTPEEPRP